MKNKLINFRLITLLSISFFIGIIFIYYIYFYNKYFLAVTALVVFLMTVSVFFILKKERLQKIIIYFIMSIICFILSIICFMTQINSFKKAEVNEKEYHIIGKITEINYISESNLKLTLSNLSLSNQNKPEYYKLSLYVEEFYENQFSIGNVVDFYGKVINNKMVYESKPNINNIINHVVYSSYKSSEEIILKKGSVDVFNIANNFIKTNLLKGLDSNSYKIAVGLILGETEQIDNQILSNYRYGGVAHIFAVSGLHIGFLAGVLLLIFKFIKRPYIKSFIISLILMFYAGICGFKVSSLRATIMAITLLFTSSSGKKYDFLSSISFSMMLILLFSPLEAFSAGFLLSYSAVYSICLLAPVIKRYLNFLPNKISGYVSVTLSATLGTFPFCIFYFHYFSLISILLNLILIPIVSFLFSFLIIGTIIGGIMNINKVALFIPKVLLNLIQIILNNNYKNLICMCSITIFLLIFYYIILVLFSDKINLNKSIKFFTTTIMIVVFCFSFFMWNNEENKEIKMCVIGENNYQVVFFYGKDNDIIINSDSLTNNYLRVCSFIKSKNITEINNIIVIGKTDVQNITTKFLEYVKIKNIYYYGEKLDYLSNGINQSFTNINDEEVFNLSNIEAHYLSSGYLVAIKTEKVNILVISEENFIEKTQYLKNSNFDMVIVKDDIDNYINLFNSRVISFVFNYENYIDAEYEKLYFKIIDTKIIQVVD